VVGEVIGLGLESGYVMALSMGLGRMRERSWYLYMYSVRCCTEGSVLE